MKNIVYRLYNWNSKVRYFYDFELKLYFVNPAYEQQFLQEVRQDT